MKNIVIACGLEPEQQLILLEAALPETHELVAAECVTDLIVTDATCTIIESSSLDKNALNTLLAYYMDFFNFDTNKLSDIKINDEPPF